MILALVDADWSLAADGPGRTTAAGRFALPVRIRNGESLVGVVELILDGNLAEQLHAALGAHLAGHGAPTARRSRAELL